MVTGGNEGVCEDTEEIAKEKTSTGHKAEMAVDLPPAMTEPGTFRSFMMP